MRVSLPGSKNGSAQTKHRLGTIAAGAFGAVNQPALTRARLVKPFTHGGIKSCVST